MGQKILLKLLRVGADDLGGVLPKDHHLPLVALTGRVASEAVLVAALLLAELRGKGGREDRGDSRGLADSSGRTGSAEGTWSAKDGRG